jgi:hypothetical protein
MNRIKFNGFGDAISAPGITFDAGHTPEQLPL